VFFSPDYVAGGPAFDTTRKAAWIAAALERDPITGLQLHRPPPLVESDLARVHDPAYVCAVRDGAPRALAESSGLAWSGSTFRMVAASNGGVVAAARAALARDGGAAVSGSLSSGLHHARRERGAGFCTFNGLALAAHFALEAGVEPVLVLDLDAHAGGGTHALLGEERRVWIRDLSVDPFDAYRPSASRNTLEIIERGADLLGAVERTLRHLARNGPRFGLCLYNAGMDPYQGCREGGRPGISAEVLAAREALVFGWCHAERIPVAFALAGGDSGPELTKGELVGLHRLTLEAAAGQGGGGAGPAGAIAV
jgi:acetoin utilization deacetylase AcuC-like enzyme